MYQMLQIVSQITGQNIIQKTSVQGQFTGPPCQQLPEDEWLPPGLV